MEARRPAGVHVLAPLGGSLVAFRGPLGRHHYSFANTRMPKTSQEALELLRSTPCEPNCIGVSRFGAFKAPKNTATTNTATEERTVTKRHYSLANTRMPKTSQEAPELLKSTLAGQTVIVFRVLELSKL